MLLGDKQFELKYEKAIRLLSRCMPDGGTRKKPIIIHSIRVGFYLYQNDYSSDIVLAGILHDIIEWTDSPQELIHDEYGQSVYDIVLANTQNKEIKDTVEKWQDMVNRCAEYGEDALIVKTADVLDSHKFYTAVDNQSEIERSTSIGKYILEKLPEGAKDKIFDELRKVIEK